MKTAKFNLKDSLPEIDIDTPAIGFKELSKDFRGVGAIRTNMNTEGSFGNLNVDVKDSLFGNHIAPLYSNV
ncbi:hypothetical protein BU107_13670 [Staphylococcus xylosus]|uniref:hypothetical protein n=1 Tax=Staphylococcus xylosus TaxID=1288 RepID=UPI000E686508|nr:hypothetical protein [Staphylococcus xylosus]RIM84424.1 hypothetical protein BU107_13670 [Staphylococcus xylosus]